MYLPAIFSEDAANLCTWSKRTESYVITHEDMLRFSTPYTYISPSDLYDIAPHCVLSFLVKADFRIIKCIKDVNEK